MRILIADDQRDVAAALAALVSSSNHEVVEIVGSGLDAIHAYARHKPDVVLMDYWMSKLNGATACRNIRAKDPQARIILISGFACAETPETLGASAILQKPVTRARLEEAIANALR
ncbi:MAG: response regulator [Chthoniobacterales bacterium]